MGWLMKESYHIEADAAGSIDAQERSLATCSAHPNPRTAEEAVLELVAPEMLEMAEEIASGSDVIGIERWRLEYLLRSVIDADRRARRTIQII